MTEGTGPFDDDSLPAKVLMVFVAEGGWHLQTVLHRVGTDHITYMPPWSEPWSDAGSDADWAYLGERVIEGRGGNGYTWEVEGFAAMTDVDVEALIVARAAEVVASSGGPLGEVAATVTFTDGEDTVSMPFVVLPDEENDLMLVATTALGDGPAEVAADGIVYSEMVFRSLDHWQRDFARCWQLDPGVEHRVVWPGGIVFLTIDEVGQITRLASAPLAAAEAAGADGGDGVDRIERFGRPEWATLGNQDSLPSSGEDSAWGWAIPAVLRTSAGPSADGRWPTAPTRDAELEDATGYWAALLHLLVYTFGWAHPDRGLRWWYDAAQPRANRRLALIADTYGTDGQLDWFAAWLWSMSTPLPGTEWMCSETPDDGDAVAVDADWLAVQRGAADAAGMPTPLSGGSDPLHLQGHLSGPSEQPTWPASVAIASDTKALAVFDDAVGWYRGLADLAGGLPVSAEWTIEVTIKAVGWLGAFRRSTTTGLWHAVSEDVHRRGN